MCDGRFIFVPARGPADQCGCPPSISRVTSPGQREAGPYSSEWGYGSSPAIHRPPVIIAADNRGSAVDRLMGTSWLAALHRQTGEIVWRVERVEGESSRMLIVARIALPRSTVDGWQGRRDLDTDLSARCALEMPLGCQLAMPNTVAIDDQHVYVTTRQPKGETLWIAATAQGTSPKPTSLARSKSGCDVPSPCVRDGCLYALSYYGL